LLFAASFVTGCASGGNAAGAGHVVYVKGKDGVLWRDLPDSTNRSKVDVQVDSFQPIDDTFVYVRGTDGKLWREQGDSKNRQFVDQQVARYRGIDANTVYVLGTDRKLWRDTTGAARSFVDEDVADFWPIDAASVYVLGNDGKLWKDAPDQTNRVAVDADVASFGVPGR
jgi:hypothetical protein